MHSSTYANNQSGNGTQASTKEPCPLCGKAHYCFLVKTDLDEVSKVLCQWTDPVNPPSGWKHAVTAKDGRPIFANLSCSTKTRKSNSYPEIIELKPKDKVSPQWQDVYIPVDQVERGHTVKLKPDAPGADLLYIVDKIDSGKNLRLGKNVSLGAELKRVSGGIGKIIVSLTDIESVITRDLETGAKEQFIEYYYSENQKVVRKQWTDRRQVYGGKSKEIRPWHKLNDGTWIALKGDKPWRLYQENEALTAIEAGDIIFAPGSEQAVEWLRSIGLTAVCNQGGEGSSFKIASALEPYFHPRLKPENIQGEGYKPLLVIWSHNDETGRTSSDKLLKACYSKKIAAISINQSLLWGNVPVPDKGDAKDWIEYCKNSGISNEEIYRRLEYAIDEAINQEEEDQRWRRKRLGWEAAVSYDGEIGKWVTIGTGEDAEQKWRPLCNFDFQIEREIEDVFGGALVLQVKRCFEDRQFRVILNSTDFTKPDVFVDALKRAMGVGVVCNLTKSELSALIHTRLHEYRTTRLGRIFKRIDRYGQQEDGTWVFGDRQYKKDGTPTEEKESGWVFNPSLGRDDYIPCPQLAPATIDPMSALRELIEACHLFFTQKNFHQAILMLGSVVAGLYYQEIRKENRSHPQINAFGDPGSQKTHAAETGLSLIGTNWPDAAMFSRVSASALFEHASRTGSLSFVWDDPPRDAKNEELGKHLFNGKPRKVRGNEQMPHSSMIVTSNHVFGGEQIATHTRNVRINFHKINDEDILDKRALQKLSAAQGRASAAFPMLLKLGYPHKEVTKLETELLHYLPNAHARTAQGLAIITWYAQALIDLVGGTENIKQWVIDNCCASENNADASGDSLSDFISKILALEAESMVGDWNFRRTVERNGQQFYAIYAQDVWKLVDQRFKPATYNDKSLKALLLKAGGITDTTVRFFKDRDQTLAYYRAKLTTARGADGEPIDPNPPETVPRKAWLIPAHLFKEDEAVTTVTAIKDGLQNPVTSQNPNKSSTSNSQDSECNYVTKNNHFIEKESDDNDETSTGTPSINSIYNQESSYGCYESSPRIETQSNQGEQRVTSGKLQDVTLLQVGDMVKISHDLHPDKGAKLQVVRIDGLYLICSYLYGKNKGQLLPLEPREVEKI